MTLRHPNARILIFAKAARPGYAKTRLIPTLGEEGAAKLQTMLTRRTIELAMHSQLAPVQLWTSGMSPADGRALCANRPDVTWHVQEGGDLGARMAHALEHSLRDAAFALLVGTDCPAMDVDYLTEACGALEDGVDAVLGPAEDGGYVLIGLRRCHERLFGDIAWGGADVFRHTVRRLQDLNWSYQVLPQRWDVDRPEDLDRLLEFDASYRLSTR